MANNSQFTGIQPLRPHIAPLGPQSALPSISMQFRPVVPPQQPSPYIPVVSQQFMPVGRPNIGMPSHTQQQLHFSQPQLPVQAGPILPQVQTIPMPDVQSNRPVISVSPQPLQTGQIGNNYIPSLGGPQMAIPLYTQINMNGTSQYQPISQTNMSSFPSGGQPWPSGSQSIKSVTPVHQTREHISVAAIVSPNGFKPIEKVQSEWIEHTSREGKRYYYNKKTKLSSWEKPFGLMTAIEKADASTDWREVTSPDGRKYYHNRITKQSKWMIPEELKLVREQVKIEYLKETQESSNVVNIHAPPAVSLGEVKSPPPISNGVSSAHVVVSSPVPVEPVFAVVNPVPTPTSGSSPLPTESLVTTNTIEAKTQLDTVSQTADASGSTGISETLKSNSDQFSSKDVVTAAEGVSAQNTDETKKGTSIAQEANINAVEDKTIVQEPIVYETKLEAKIAFKALLETANVGSDWIWDQAMRLIINDSRYGALKTLGERKQAFNEFVGQKKKQEAEERRSKQKKAREDFKKMLEESKELTSSVRRSKAIALFEDDERFKAVERIKDREELLDDYFAEIDKKARAKALEEHKRNKMEFIDFLRSCDFIKANTQWRKVQERLEVDERCSRLENFVRFEIFQEYTRDLEKEEEEQRRLKMEEARKAERRNREEFRKLMAEHVAAGTLTPQTHWREYCLKVKELPTYLAVSSNTSGATAKDLFEDAAEELQKQYAEDKTRIKDAVKLGKITLTSTWSIEDFKSAILDDISSPTVSDTNLKLVFDELQEKVKEKEEKEAKKRKRLADDFYEFLCSFKEITASSRWEDCKPLFEARQENWFNAEDSLFQEIFEKYITELIEIAREKERKRKEEKAKKDKDREKRKAKHRRDKEKGKEKERPKKDEADSENGDRARSYSFEENKRSGRDKNKKHRKRHPSSLDALSLDEIDKDRSKIFHRHSIDRKKLKQMEHHSEADYESRSKRHKRDHRNGSFRNSNRDERKEMDFD